MVYPKTFSEMKITHSILFVNEKLRHNMDVEFLLLTHESQEYVTPVAEQVWKVQRNKEIENGIAGSDGGK